MFALCGTVLDCSVVLCYHWMKTKTRHEVCHLEVPGSMRPGHSALGNQMLRVLDLLCSSVFRNVFSNLSLGSERVAIVILGAQERRRTTQRSACSQMDFSRTHILNWTRANSVFPSPRNTLKHVCSLSLLFPLPPPPPLCVCVCWGISQSCRGEKGLGYWWPPLKLSLILWSSPFGLHLILRLYFRALENSVPHIWMILPSVGSACLSSAKPICTHCFLASKV